MASVVELRPHAREEFTASLGMSIFLASWAMMFSALFFAYGFVRMRAPVWPPVGVERLPLGLPALNTAVLLASSATIARAISHLKKGRRADFTRWVGATLLLGLGFLGAQLWVWRSVAESGLTIATNLYGSVFYGFTVFHALHVAVGLIVVGWMLVRSLSGAYTEHNTIGVRVAAMFWHFVDVVWVLMFVTIYLI